jgi:3-hydroxyacyl-CoA dehydrogenase/enoyl-CoA hydratase/3-hydroxybutyryl-CoA epimerase
MSAFQLTITDAIAHLVFDLPDEKVNKFTAAVMDELDGLLAGLERRLDLRAVVIRSGKPDVFIAGADISEISGLHTREQARNKAERGQGVFNRLASLRVPTIAVIDGACLGGGMELALACTWRVVTDAEKTKLGLPEVTLGIIPGWGGTQRLPRLVGLPLALDLICSGRQIAGGKAVKLGLADVCVARAFLADDLPGIITRLLAGARPVLPFGVRAMGAPGLRGIVLSRARAEVMRKTQGLMPAPLGAIDVLRRTTATTLTAGLAIEAEVFSDLAITPACHHLVAAFFAAEELKKSGGRPAREVEHVGVLGAGVMGGGIAWAFAGAGIAVRMKDLTWPAVAKGLQQASTYNHQLVKLRKLTPGEANLRMQRIAGTLDFSGFAACDLVVEAVVEDLAVKRKVLAEVESHVSPECVLATNTSSLSVTAMAEGLAHPERVVGMHFFNPVNRMPLVEVIAGVGSSPAAVQLTAATARRLGKTVVVVRDCPGFLVNRILLPYLNEAARTVVDGAAIEQVERVIGGFGMPMGPFTLTDEVGIDVGHKVARILAQGYGERHAVAELLAVIYEKHHLTGTKSGKGFFLHQGKQLLPNPEIEQAIAETRSETRVAAHLVTDDEVLDRCLLMMVNESARCLEEGVVAKAAYLDLAMLMGTGFPPAKGGPLQYAASLGLPTVVDRLRALTDQHGPRFTPAQILIDHARTGQALL